jgi:hypothetical protein
MGSFRCDRLRLERVPLHLTPDTHRVLVLIKGDIGGRQNLAAGDVTRELDMMRQPDAGSEPPE